MWTDIKISKVLNQCINFLLDSHIIIVISECHSPFDLVDGIGRCLSFYIKHRHGLQAGIAQCTNRGGDIFEFNDFETEQGILFQYFKFKNGTVSVLFDLFVEIMSFHISE